MQNLTYPDRALFAIIAQSLIDGFMMLANKPFSENEILDELIPNLHNPSLVIAESISDLIPRWERFKDYPEQALNEMTAAEVVSSLVILSQDFVPKGLSGTQKKMVLMLQSRLQLALLVESTTDDDNMN